MEKELKLKTSWKAQTTHVHFGNDRVFTKLLKPLLDETNHRVVAITDTHVDKLYRDKLESFDIKVFSFPPGEANKSRETKQMLEDHLLSHNFGRDTLILSIGGGVVSDVVGFLASTYCRGVPYILIPTSFLAMVDAAVGGKTGVNTPYGKNLIGTFYPPKEVWIDGIFLKTLPESQWINGLVEMIKAGLIASPSLYNALKDNVELWKKRDLDFIMQRIYESVSIKLDIVEKDPEEERGMRRMLNLGHTFGHALENLEKYTLDHGRAVAIGILTSCYLSKELGYLDEKIFEEIRRLFTLYQIPLYYTKEHTLEQWMAILARDKKSRLGTPRMVLIDEIGSVMPFDGEYCDEIDFSLLEQTLLWMHEQFYRPS